MLGLSKYLKFDIPGKNANGLCFATGNFIYNKLIPFFFSFFFLYKSISWVLFAAIFFFFIMEKPLFGQDIYENKEEIKIPSSEENEKESENLNIHSQPFPKKGLDFLYKSIHTEIVYPTNFYESGLVYVQFTVEEDGSISDPAIIKGLNKRIDKEVLRAFKKAVKHIDFEPEKKDGEPVQSRMVIALYIKPSAKKKK